MAATAAAAEDALVDAAVAAAEAPQTAGWEQYERIGGTRTRPSRGNGLW